MTTIAPTRADLYRYDRVSDRLNTPDALTQADVQAYERNGFVAVENLLTSSEVTSAREALSALIHGQVPGYNGLQPEAGERDMWPQLSPAERADRIRKVWRFVEHSPTLKALATQHAPLQTLLTRLVGEPARLIQDMALLKPPFIGGEKPWHQDAAYFGWGPPDKIIGVWIALDPATAENGCMHVVPGSHQAGPTPHVHLRDCQIPDEAVRVEKDVLVPLAPGGAMFFSSLVHHGTPPNASPHRRWALQFHYAAESCVPLDRAEHEALFFDEGRYAGCRG